MSLRRRGRPARRARASRAEPTVHARLHGRGSRLLLEVDDPGAFAGTRDAPAVRALAEALAAPGRGDPGRQRRSAPGLARRRHRAVVAAPGHRSRRIRIGSLRGALDLGALAGPGARAACCPTPSCSRRRRCGRCADHAAAPAPRRSRPPTTRRAAAHRGWSWRKEDVWAGRRQPVYGLPERHHDRLRPRLRHLPAGPGAAARRVEHDERDEYVVHRGRRRDPRCTAPSSTGRSCAPGPGSRSATHRLVFFREEYADHGRPYGGRIGGEAGHQMPAAAAAPGA